MKLWLVTVYLLLVGAVEVCLGAEVRLYANGRPIVAVPAIVVREGVSYVPLRVVGEALGAKIEWRTAQRLAVVCRGQCCILVKAEEGIIRSGRLLLPLRRLAEALRAQVRWTGGKRPRIDITLPTSD